MEMFQWNRSTSQKKIDVKRVIHAVSKDSNLGSVVSLDATATTVLLP